MPPSAGRLALGALIDRPEVVNAGRCAEQQGLARNVFALSEPFHRRGNIVAGAGERVVAEAG